MNNTVTPESGNRIMWIDLARGLAILTVIAGHTFGGIPLVITMTLALELFFTLSGITTKYSTSISDYLGKLAKSAVSLLLPSFILYLLYRLLDFQRFSLPGVLVSILFSRCNDFTLFGTDVRGVSVLWFLSALFCLRSLFDLLQLYVRKVPLGIITAILMLVGVMLGSFHIILPLNLDIALAMTPFMWLGYVLRPVLLKNEDSPQTIKNPLPAAIGFLVAFGVLLFILQRVSGTYFKLSDGEYPLFPLCHITSFFGVMFALTGCVILDKFNTIKAGLLPITILGRYSMILYCIHSLDMYWKKIWECTSYSFVNFLIRLLIDIAATGAYIFVTNQIKRKN